VLRQLSANQEKDLKLTFLGPKPHLYLGTKDTFFFKERLKIKIYLTVFQTKINVQNQDK